MRDAEIKQKIKLRRNISILDESVTNLLAQSNHADGANSPRRIEQRRLIEMNTTYDSLMLASSEDEETIVQETKREDS